MRKRKTIKESFEVGKKYWNLTLLEILEDRISKKGRRNAMGLFLCDCGNIKEIRLACVWQGRNKACGCMRGRLDFIKEKQNEAQK